MSDSTLSSWLVVRVPDFDDAAVELLTERDRNKEGEIVRRRKRTFDRRKFATDKGLVDAVIEDREQLVECRDTTVDRTLYVTEKPSLG